MAENYTVQFWNRLSYHQKHILYKLVNDVAIYPSERFLNKWWYSLSFYKRDEIINILFEFKKELDNDSRTI